MRLSEVDAHRPRGIGAIHAALDIGTNTLLALVGRVGPDGEIERLADLATITRLGEGVDRTRRLAPAAMDRALTALRSFVARARDLGAVSISAVATSAVRDADNREEFLAAARAIAGDNVQVISGEREAELTFAGAFVGTEISTGARALVFDVGGGSTEVITGRAGAAAQTRISLEVGSVRLTERFVANDPPSVEEIHRVRDAITAELLRLGPASTYDVVLGLAGTVTTLAALDRAVISPDGAAVHGAQLALEAVERWTARLASLPLQVRRTLPGLDPRRADVIVAGAEIVQAVMHWAHGASLVVSDGGVRVGLLLEGAGR